MFNYIAKYTVLILAAFLGDIMLYGLFAYPAISCMRVLFYTQLCTKQYKINLIWYVFFILIESFIYSNTYAIDLIVIMPLGLLLFLIINIIDMPRFLMFFLILFCLIAHYVIVDFAQFLRPLNELFNWYILLIYSILIVFLLYYILGSQGNRSKK